MSDHDYSRIAAVRDRLAHLMGWPDKIGSTGHRFEVVRRALDGGALLVGVDKCEAIAERLERKKVRVEAAELNDAWLPVLVLVGDDEEVNIIYEPCGSKVAAIEEARRVAEQLGLEVAENKP